jgi:hypothetical protein
MRWFLVLILLLVSVSPASGGELFVFYGNSSETGRQYDSFAYQVEYREGLGENAAVTVSYLNEGHLPNHHRDGLAPFTLWGRVNLLDRHLSLAVGAGPYLYADTTQTPLGLPSNEHGLGGLFGASATWYLESRLLFQARINWVMTRDRFDIDTVTAVAGIGYQLDDPVAVGPLLKPPSQRERTTNNELTLFLGQTVVNNPGNPKSIASCVEYRHGLFPYLDVTAALLNEGDNELIRRNGAITQLWLVRDFMGDHLALGGGFGAYLAIDKRGGPPPDKGGSAFASGIMSVTASLRNFSFNPDLTVRLMMNRIVTNYSKDTDIFLFGLGYRF